MIRIIICVIIAFILGAVLTMCLTKYKHIHQNITKGGAPTAFYTNNQKMNTTLLSHPVHHKFVVSSDGKCYNSHIEFYAFKLNINDIPMFKCGVEASTKNVGDMMCEYKSRVGNACTNIQHYYTNFFTNESQSGIDMGIILTAAEQCGHAMIAILLDIISQFINQILKHNLLTVQCFSHEHLSAIYSISNEGSECYTYTARYNDRNVSILCDIFSDDNSLCFIIGLATLMTNTIMCRFLTNTEHRWNIESSVINTFLPDYLKTFNITENELSDAICTYIDSNCPKIINIINAVAHDKIEVLTNVSVIDKDTMLGYIRNMEGGGKPKLEVINEWNSSLSGGENMGIVHSGKTLVFMRDIIRARTLNIDIVSYVLTSVIFNNPIKFNSDPSPMISALTLQGIEHRNANAGLYNQFISCNDVESIYLMWTNFIQGNGANTFEELIAYATICIYFVSIFVDDICDVKTIALRITDVVNEHANINAVKDGNTALSEIYDFLYFLSRIIDSPILFIEHTSCINNLFIELLSVKQDLISILECVDEIIEWYFDSQNAMYILKNLMSIDAYKEYITHQLSDRMCDIVHLYDIASPDDTHIAYSTIMNVCAQKLQCEIQQL